MKMIDARKEIEDKLFCGERLSFDTMLCALAAINAYIDEHGDDSGITLEINLGEEIHRKAGDQLMEELRKGFESAEEEGWMDADDIRNILFDGENLED